MDLTAWLFAFRKLHEKYRRNELDEEDMKSYLAGRDELARAIVVAQRLTLKPGETPRQALRVARALPIDLDLNSGRVRVLTLDLSRGGFCALIEKTPGPDESVGFTLKVPGGDAVIGRCKLVDSSKRLGNSRASFAFHKMSEADQDRIETVLFDSVLEQFRSF